MKPVNVFERSELQKLHRYGCALCKNPDHAYDLLQYAIEKYLQKPNPKKNSNDISYVQTIMRNRFIDEYRKSTRFPEESYDENTPMEMDEKSLEDIIVAQFDLDLIWEKLDTSEREILYYWAIEGMTAQEISNQINTPRGTVLSRLYRIRKRFGSETRSKQSAGGFSA